MGVVFVGGCIGTGLRYACSFIADYGAFHFGTFTANMIACFAYATLSAWLGGSARLTGNAKEYVNRGFGMGLCGGLVTFLAGFAFAYAGSRTGSHIANTRKGA